VIILPRQVREHGNASNLQAVIGAPPILRGLSILTSEETP
jgi:hypothetical protein